MCRKMKRTIRAVICVITMSVFNVVPVFACTPKLNPPSVKIPDINFEPDDALKEAINNAAKTGLRNASSILRQWSTHRITRVHQDIGLMGF